MPPRQRNAAGRAGRQHVAPQRGRGRPILPFPPRNFGPILDTDFVNTPLRDHRTNWTSKAVGGKTIDSLGGPEWAWVPLHDHDDEYGGELTGMSGTIVQAPEVSSEDMPFTHPFGKDFEFHVAPDPAYAALAGPIMRGSYAVRPNVRRTSLVWMSRAWWAWSGTVAWFRGPTSRRLGIGCVCLGDG